MSRISLLIIGLVLAACAPATLGPNAPLQLTHQANTIITPVAPSSARARADIAQCYDRELQAFFQAVAQGGHYGALAVGREIDGSCTYFWFRNFHNVDQAERTVLGICQNEGVECAIAARAVPDMNISLGARTLSGPASGYVANTYLTAQGFSAIAMNDDGPIGVAFGLASQAAADQEALRQCQQDIENGEGWNLDRPDEATRIFRATNTSCQIVHRRAANGTTSSPVLQ